MNRLKLQAQQLLMKAGEKDTVIQREMEDILEQLKRRKVANPRKQHRRERSMQVRMSTSSKKTLQTEVLLETEEDPQVDAFNNIMGHHHHMHGQEEADKDMMSEVQGMNQKTLSELNEHTQRIQVLKAKIRSK